MRTAATAEVDAAGKPADHPALPDLPADFLDRFVLECPHRPIAGAAGDVAHEVAQDGGAVRRVDDFEMELRGVEPALLVGDHRDRRIGRGADGRRNPPAAALPGRHGSSTPDSAGRPPTRRHRGPKAASPPPRRGRIRDDGRPRPCRRAGAPWPARHSKCRAPARRPDKSPPAQVALPCRTPKPARPKG